MTFDQALFDIGCEWGAPGLSALAPTSDVIVIVDVLSFSTAVDVATVRGATVFPHHWQDESSASSAEYARVLEAELAEPRGRGVKSLSPTSLIDIENGARLVLPSLNGASLSLATGERPTLTGCLRNAAAVAEGARRLGRRIAVVPAGEQWPQGGLRPCLEDWLGAGAILSLLGASVSPEARAAIHAYEAAGDDLEAALLACGSGRELVDSGFAEDVSLASELNVSRSVPLLVDRGYVNQIAAPPL
jgi:2-phosphosulfolactate phosphatase